MPRRRLLSFLVALLLAACSSGPSAIERAEPAAGGDAPDTSTGPASSATSGSSSTVDDAEPAVPLRLGVVSTGSLDPLEANPASVSDVLVADLLHDTLTELGDDGTVRSGLARFGSDLDRRVWRFDLRGDATFGDGSPITADDVAFSLERIRAQGAASLPGTRLGGVVAIRALDARSVEIELAEPSALLPEILSSPLFGIVRRGSAVDAGPDVTVGSGDYAVTVDGGTLRLARRPGVDEGPAVVVVERYVDDSAAYAAFVDGAVDWSPVPVDRAGEALREYGADAIADYGATVLLGVNPAATPLDNPSVRRAIALAVDRVALVDAVFGPAASPAAGLVPAGIVGAVGECPAPSVCPPDPETASTLVANAFPDGQFVPIRLLVDASTTFGDVGRILVGQFAAVGLDVAVAPLDASTFARLVATRQQQLFLYSTLAVGRSPAPFLQPFASTSPERLSGYANPLVDDAIAGAADEPSPDRRVRRWQEIEAAILTDVPAVPLAQLRTLAVQRPTVTGLDVRADGSIDLTGAVVTPAG